MKTANRTSPPIPRRVVRRSLSTPLALAIGDEEPLGPPWQVSPTSSQNILTSLNREDIEKRLRRYGALLFRGFAPTMDEFKSLTAKFCEYFISYPGEHRGRVANETDIQTVDVKKVRIRLHSEMSYSPMRPDLAWFFCVVPPKEGGATILCDGIAMADAMPPAVKRWLAGRRLRFKTDVGPRTWQKMFGCKTIAQLRNVIRQRSYKDTAVIGDRIRIDHLTAPLAPTKYGKRVAFCNNLMLHRGMQTDVYFADGSVLPDSIYDELVRVSDGLTVEIAWKSGDVLMVDNTRMMHGRRTVLDDERLVLTRFGS